jgi:hypothetical protein
MEEIMNADKELTRRLAESIGDLFGLTEAEVQDKGREEEATQARYLIFQFLKREKKWTFKRVAKSFKSEFHHSTVINGVNELENMTDYSRDFAIISKIAHKAMVQTNEHFYKDLENIEFITIPRRPNLYQNEENEGLHSDKPLPKDGLVS